MAKSSSENVPCCSKDCKKNNDSLNSKIKDLTSELSEANNYIYHYKLAVAQLEGRLLEMYRASNLKCIKTLNKELETLKEEKDVVDGKLARLLKSSKDLENLIESQRSDKIKDGVGYNAVPPAAADLYLSPKKDLSWTGLPEFVDDTVTDYSREPTDSILSKPMVKFVKAVDRPTERPTTNKAKTMKKPTAKYAKMYRRPSKKPTVRGNQRNWNNLKTQQLGPDFPMKKKACYNYGDFSHLANYCRKKVQRETTRSQNHAYLSPSHRSAGHRSYGAPMGPPYRSAGHRPHGAPMRPSYRPAGHRPHGPPMKPMRPI
nr:ubiquitin hydrolase [Tanacetum cinerariifolium]